MMAESGQIPAIRLDKWLWAARFFKTRSLATEAINGGKVHVDEQRVKPGKPVRVGATIRIRKNLVEWTVVVRGVSKQRRPATEAALLYEETPESYALRVDSAEKRRQQGIERGTRERRPDKRGRRLIHQFKNRNTVDSS